MLVLCACRQVERLEMDLWSLAGDSLRVMTAWSADTQVVMRLMWLSAVTQLRVESPTDSVQPLAVRPFGRSVR